MATRNWTTPVTNDEKEHHFYQTPLKLAQVALNIINPDKVHNVLDCGAGNGIWGMAAQDYFSSSTKIMGAEIRNVSSDAILTYDHFYVGDFLELTPIERVDCFIGNPPFKLGQKFVEHCLKIGVDGCTILFLLPNNFGHTIDRGKWLWSGNSGLYKEYKLMERPSFKDGIDSSGKVRKGATDIGKEYCLYHFIKGYIGRVETEAFWWKGN